MPKKSATKPYDVYYFESFDLIDLSKINGDAILLVGESPLDSSKQNENVNHPGPQKNQTLTTAYFVKNQQFVTGPDNQPKTALWRIDNPKWKFIKNNHDKRKHDILFVKDHRKILNDISLLAKVAEFPYQAITATFSKKADSITLKRLVYTSTHQYQFIDPTTEDNIHPVAKDYLTRKNHDDYNSLSFLYALKADPTSLTTINLSQEGGIKIGLGAERGSFHEVTVDEMIDFIRKENKAYLNFDEVKARISEIEKRTYSSRELHRRKEKIFTDFQQFYAAHASDPTMLSRARLVESWANDYMNRNKNENPFTVLSQQQRTGFSAFFSPDKTNSMKLFDKFLYGEVVSHELTELMQANKTEEASSKHKNTMH